jgi:pyruvate-formate lyase-activating enzyme
MSDSTRLRITEIFYSLQGESTLVGLPTVFVRLTGCPLRCGYCDTEYAFQGGEWMLLDEILQQLSVHWRGYAMPAIRCHWKPVVRWMFQKPIRGSFE